MKSSRKHTQSDSEDSDDQEQIPGPNCLFIEQRDEDQGQDEDEWLEEVQEEILSDNDVIHAIRGWVEFTPFERSLLISGVRNRECTQRDLNDFRYFYKENEDDEPWLTHDVLKSVLGSDDLVDYQPLQTSVANIMKGLIQPKTPLRQRSETMDYNSPHVMPGILREEQKYRVIAWTLRQLGVNSQAVTLLNRSDCRDRLDIAEFPRFASDLTSQEPRLCDQGARAGSLRSQDAILADRSLTGMQRMARIAPFHFGKYSWEKPTNKSQFGQWLQGKRDAPPDTDSEMNCWEAILMLAFYAGVQVPRRAGLTNSEPVATQLFGLDNANEYRPDNTGWYPNLPQLQEGQIVFFGNTQDGDTFHVALALGTQDERGYQEIYSLWTDIGGQTGLSTVEESVMGQLRRGKKTDWIKIGDLDEPHTGGL